MTSKKNYHHGDLAAELLKAAEAELREQGIEAFSLRAVAKRAGVSHGAPAHHFRDARGLLTALATAGYRRLLQAQEDRQSTVKGNAAAQLVASGLSYIQFAEDNPALFRLMFASEKPNRTEPDFAAAASATFGKLVADVHALLGVHPWSDPTAMKQVMSSWAMAHGLADLLISGRAENPLGLASLPRAGRDAMLSEIMLTALSSNERAIATAAK